MKIAIIADSPLLTTGFGVESSHVASALAETGHQVICFGLKGSPRDPNTSLNFKIIPVDVSTRWDVSLREFLWREIPELVIILIDLFNLREIINYFNFSSWTGPIWVYLTPDGLPAYQDYLKPLSRVQKCIVTTHACANYLQNCGIHVDAIIPGGVDTEIFSPLKNRLHLREKAGVNDKFVVGVFGRNCERKQQYRVLESLARIKALGGDADIIAYFHCSKRGYWHLDEIAYELGVNNMVIFAEGYQDETRGVSYRNTISADNDTLAKSTGKSKAESSGFSASFGYVERINCCDLIVNAASCGDFEHIILESQACGIPLAQTDDRGIMAEAMGEGAIKLKTSNISRGRIGQNTYLVDPDSITKAILAVKKDHNMAQKMKMLGLRYAQSHPWSILRNEIVALVNQWSSFSLDIY